MRGLLSLMRESWLGYAGALGAVAVVSGFIGLVQGYLRIANISMLYLIAVLAIALAFGRGPAILVSIAAFLGFNWFFVEPLHSFTVTQPEEWFALLLFLLTAGVTGQLAAGQRLRAEEAEQREREAVVLYDVVRLMSEPDVNPALHAVAERLRQELRVAAVVIQLADGSELETIAAAGDPEAMELAASKATAPSQLLGEGRAPTEGRRGEPGRWVRVVPPRSPGSGHTAGSDRLYVVPVRVADRRVGALLLVSAPGAPSFGAADDRLLSAVVAQFGLAVERIRLRRDATEAEILRRASELKTALLNAVSHDLRTPLASIIASAGSLLQSDVGWTDRERRDFAEAIEEEARRLNRIVGSLLDLSRIQAGNLRPEKGWYDLGALVDDVVGRLSHLTARHPVVVEVQEDLPPVSLDYVEIDQVLSNLIENAAKYAPPDTEIRVSARCAGSEALVEVADRGPGIPAAALPRLFEPFFRSNSVGPRPQGTGLGLAVARGLVEAHGGRIWAENRPGGGARFSFTLPLKKPAETPVPQEEMKA